VGLLDENPYPFADPRGRKLHDDVAELYNPRSAEALSRQAALPIARIDFQGSARDVWQNVLDAAAKCGELRRLAQVIVDDPMSVKARPLLQSLLQEAVGPGGGEAINEPDPSERTPGALRSRRAARTIWRLRLIIAITGLRPPVIVNESLA